MLAEPVRIALRIGEVLDRLEVAWIVGGSVASSIHGIPRATQDIDLVADLRRMHVMALTQCPVNPARRPAIPWGRNPLRCADSHAAMSARCFSSIFL